jgi:hypothetical protein
MSAKKSDATKAKAPKAKKATSETPIEQAPHAEAAAGKPAKKAKKAKDAKPRKTSALDAAAKVLAELGEPMNCPLMIEAMAARGYWKSPGGQNPAATLSVIRKFRASGSAQ